jgi:hypothetical protein
VLIERREQTVHPRGVVVIEQQPHTHTAIRGATQRIEQQAAGEIVVPDVVLQVEAAGRGIDERDARGEGVGAIAKGVDAVARRAA